MHVDLRQGLGAMMLGFAIHGAYLATRSFIVPVLIHFGNNGIAVVHFNAKLYPVLDTIENLLQSSPFLLFASGALLFAAVIHALFQTRSRNVSTVPGLEPWKSEGVS